MEQLKPATNSVECVVDSQCALGEGPIWVARESCIYWVDIKNAVIHRWNTQLKKHELWSLQEMVTSLTTTNLANIPLLGTSRHGLVAVDFEQRTLRLLQNIEGATPGNRFNDGKVDQQGHFWFGSMDDDEVESTGKLYRLDKKGPMSEPEVMDEDYIITNGPAFSVDGTVMYHTDTLAKTIYRFDISKTGQAINKQVFIEIPEDAGYPDGMTVDQQDCLWVCHFGGYRVTRYNSQGELVETIPMPVANTTSCTFAGDNLDTLFFTTARKGLSQQQLAEQPLAGGLFMLNVTARGVAALPYGENTP